MKIGVLASQGAFVEHISVLQQLGAETLPVRLPQQLAGLDGLIIPGGESTSISKLIGDYKLFGEIKDMVNNGLSAFGTCAGMVLLAAQVSDGGNMVEPLGVIEMKVRRNAYGRQKESFETELSIPVLGEKQFHGVFIRAPLIEEVNGKVETLAKLDNGSIVAARQGKILVSAFHPELTEDSRFHQYFIEIVSGQK